MKKLLLIVSICALASCSKPIDKKYNEDNVNKDLKDIGESENWSEDDAILFNEWLMKSKLNKRAMDNKTYQQILDEAKAFTAEQQVLASRAKNEEVEKKSKMSKAITVKMYEKEYVPQNIDAGKDEEYNKFKYTIKNNTDKEIKAIGLSFKIYNTLGEQIGDVFGLDFINGIISPYGIYKGVATFSGHQFDDTSNVLKNTKFEDLTFDFIVSKIVYADGTTLE